jgi:WD40 repeat protein
VSISLALDQLNNTMRIIYLITFVFLFLFLIQGCYQDNMRFQTIKGIDTIDWASLNRDGSLIIMGSVDSKNGKDSIVLYDVTTKQFRTIWESEQMIQRATFHPLKSNYIACCDEINIVLIDWKDDKVLFQIPIEDGFIPGMAFSPDGLYLFIVHSYFSEKFPDGWDETKNGPYCVSEIIKIDVESQTVLEKIILKNEIVEGTDIDTVRNIAGIRYMGGEAEIWDLNHGKCIQSVTHIRGSKCILFVDDNHFLTDAYPDHPSLGLDNNVIMWNIKDGSHVRGYRPHKMELSGIGIVYNKKGERFILSGSADRRACLWNLDTGKIIWSKRFRFDVRVRVSKDGHRAVLASFGDPILVEF